MTNTRVLNTSPIKGVTSSIQPAKSANWRFWGMWVMVLVAVSAVFFSLMDIAPYLHGDEFMIVDIGRHILNPGSSWSITWIIDRGQPAFVFFYIGPVIQEFAYQALGQYGPRISGIIGALAASTVMVEWLIARGTPRFPALLLSLVFLLDPIYVQSYTLGRLDGWSMALCLAACLVLRWRGQYFFGSNLKNKVMLAGAFAAIAVFVWPSSVFLFPLIIGELVGVIVKIRDVKGSAINSFSSFIQFGVAGLTVTLLMLLPIAPQFFQLFGNLMEGLMLNLRTGPSSGEGELDVYSMVNPVLELLRGLKFTPFLFVFALVGVALRRDVVLILSGLAAIILLLFTVVYLHRILYLLPYLVALASGLFERRNIPRLSPKVSNALKAGGILTLLAWAVSISLIARSVIALDERGERNRTLVLQAAQAMIGPGKHAVYLPGPEFYLAGRSLGWKMYRRYAAIGDRLTPEHLNNILPRIDYLIMPAWEETNEFDRLLNQAGLHDAGWYHVYPKYIRKADTNEMSNEKRLRNLFYIYQQPYGPYKLYARKLERGVASAAENVQE